MATRKVRIDAATVCQLRCPRCVTGTRELGPTVGDGLLRVAHLCAFLDLHPEVREVELSGWGEILLNPRLPDLLRLAHERGVALTARNGVNLNTAKGSVLEDLVRYRFKALTVSIDGASQETYSVYRIGGDFEHVIENVRTINRHKEQYRSSYPLLTWKFIRFGHNQHEEQKARAMAHELGMVFYPDINWDGSYAPLSEPQEAPVDSGAKAVEIAAPVEQTGSHFTKNWCLQLWNEPQVNWDGKVLGCCINTWFDFGGDAFGDAGALEGERLEYAKQMLLGAAPARDDVPCSVCMEYRAMQRSDRWITPREIRRDRVLKRIKDVVHVALDRRGLRPLGTRLLSWAAARYRRRA